MILTMSKLTTKYLVLILTTGVIMTLLCGYVYGDEIVEKHPQFIKAEIYYYGWDVLTRQKLSSSDVRNGYKIYISITDSTEVAKLVKWLRLDELQSVTNNKAEDARLTIDLFKINGNRITYYASRFNLLTENASAKRSINKEFRDKFHF
jgi:hypothetical protein